MPVETVPPAAPAGKIGEDTVRRNRAGRAAFRAGLGALATSAVFPVCGAGAQPGDAVPDATPTVRTTPSGPVPILLVPGWGDDAADLALLHDRFMNAGWPREAVSALTFMDPVGSNEVNAGQVGRALDELARSTGSEHVDVVAHSMGGLAVRQLLTDGTRLRVVRRLVFLGTPHRGTVTAAVAWGDGGREMFPGSEFLGRLNAAEPVVGIEMLSVRTSIDTRVIPGSSAMLPGAYNVEVCCPTHLGLVGDAEVFEELRRFLVGGPDAVTLPDATIHVEPAALSP